MRATLAQHLKENVEDKDLATLILIVSRQAKVISEAFFTQQHMAGTKNIHGEQQMALDKMADYTVTRALEASKLVRTVASEEKDEVVEIIKAKGDFGVTLDPLDGSSLIDVNLAVGTIAGIFNEGDVMEKGEKMDAAMYILYGPMTTLVYTTLNGVHEFAFNGTEFYLQQENLKISEGKIYSPGGRRNEFFEKDEKLCNTLESEGYILRYSGSMTADINQVLKKGGLFFYPNTKKYEKGKLRLVFEANPMAVIMKEAGGNSTDGIRDILSTKPTGVGDRIPLYIGGKKEISLVKNLHRG